MKINHIGIITGSIETDAAIYRALGYEELGEAVEDTVQNNKLLFLKNADSGEVLELIEPLNERSSVYSRPKGYAHICYEVGDIDGFVASFRKRRLGIVFTEKVSAPAFGGRSVVFAMLKNKTLVEFLET